MAKRDYFEVGQANASSLEMLSCAIIDLVSSTRVLLTTERHGERRAIYEYVKPDNILGLAAVSSTVGIGGNVFTVQYEPSATESRRKTIRESFSFRAPDIETTQVRESERAYRLLGRTRYRKPRRQERPLTYGEVDFMWQVVGALMKQRQLFGEVRSGQA